MTLLNKYLDIIKKPFKDKGFYYDLNTAEECSEVAEKFAIDFYQWMRINDTKENADKYFHFTDKDMLNEFKKSL